LRILLGQNFAKETITRRKFFKDTRSISRREIAAHFSPRHPAMAGTMLAGLRVFLKELFLVSLRDFALVSIIIFETNLFTKSFIKYVKNVEKSRNSWHIPRFFIV
jgi:hypothetical protein